MPNRFFSNSSGWRACSRAPRRAPPPRGEKPRPYWPESPGRRRDPDAWAPGAARCGPPVRKGATGPGALAREGYRVRSLRVTATCVSGSRKNERVGVSTTDGRRGAAWSRRPHADTRVFVDATDSRPPSRPARFARTGLTRRSGRLMPTTSRRSWPRGRPGSGRPRARSRSACAGPGRP